MKRLLYFSFFITLFLACKKDSVGSMDSFTVQSIAGIWKLSEIERLSLGNKNVWEPVPAAKSDTLVFRNDGVILNPNGTPRCCAPKSLVINGKIMDIVPQLAIPANPVCASVNCVYCPTWELSWNDDVLIVSSCLGSKTKYVR